MIEVKGIARKWGNSIGVIFPKEVVRKAGIKENKKIKMLIIEQSSPVKETFGILKGKWKRSSQEIKDEMRKELYND